MERFSHGTMPSTTIFPRSGRSSRWQLIFSRAVICFCWFLLQYSVDSARSILAFRTTHRLEVSKNPLAPSLDQLTQGTALTTTKRLLKRSRLSAVSDASDNTESDDPDFQRRNQQWVVLVDDEESIRFAVGDFLYGKGYEVTACADAGSLLELIASRNSKRNDASGDNQRLPDIIISDVRMPESDKNGYELVQFLRSKGPSSGTQIPPFLEKLKTVPIVLLTAKAMTEDRIQGYKAGADVVLPKPFSPDELISIIDNLILRKQERLRFRRTSAKSHQESLSAPKNEDFRELKIQLEEIKGLMQQNAARTVQKTNVVLTDQERMVVQLLSEGYTPPEVQNTIWPKNSEDENASSGHNQSIHKVLNGLYEQTQTKSKTELIRWARTVGYIS